MADKRITNLPLVEDVFDENELVIQQSDGTKRAKISDLPVVKDALALAERAEAAADRAENGEVRMNLDGTLATYRRVMKEWFNLNGVNARTPQGITDLVDEWYRLSRSAWSGGVRFAQPSQSAVSTGSKTGDNAGLSCTPSTNTSENRDDYKGLPLFAITLCNFEYDNTNKRPLITAIQDITDGFELDNPNKYVGVLQQSAFHYYDEADTYYEHGICAHIESDHDYCEPYPEAVEQDGTMRQWVLHAKYMNHTVNNKLTSYSGVVPTAWMSENVLIDRKNSMNNGLCGGCITDNAFLQLMFFIKYGSMSADGILQGCVNYNYQYYAAVGETGVKRVLVSTSQGNNIIVGSTLLVGTYNGSNADRGAAQNYNISGNHGFIVKSKENVTINGTTYTAINFDTDTTFDTVGNGAAVSGNTIISTFHWKNGSCDNVLGNDGSPANPGTGQYPAMLQGIEYMMGGYEVYADVILSQDAEKYMVYVVDDVSKQSKSSIADYTDIGVYCPKVAAADGWKYPKKLGFGKGVFFPVDASGSSSQYLKDGFYMNGTNVTSGFREWPAFCSLNFGAGLGGLSALLGGNGLSSASWSLVARLSCNGNRGEWTA